MLTLYSWPPCKDCFYEVAYKQQHSRILLSAINSCKYPWFSDHRRQPFSKQLKASFWIKGFEDGAGPPSAPKMEPSEKRIVWHPPTKLEVEFETQTTAELVWWKATIVDGSTGRFSYLIRCWPNGQGPTQEVKTDMSLVRPVVAWSNLALQLVNRPTW